MRTFALSLSALAFSAAPALAFDGPTDAAPVCQNNGPYVFEANNAPGTTTTDVQLSSAGSFDPDGDALTFFWFEECPRGVFFDPTASTSVLALEAEKTLILDIEETIKAADDAKIAIVGL